MRSITVRPIIRRNRRGIHARWATALSLIAVLLLAACGTNEASLPTYEEPVADKPYDEDVVGPDPIALASFVAEAEAEAETGTALQALAAGALPFEALADPLASRGGFVAQPDWINASTTGSAVAQVPFDLAVADTYTLWVRMYAPSPASDATYLGFDGATHRVFAPEQQRYMWIEVVTEELDAGRHVISLGLGEPGLRVDLFAVTRRRDVGSEDLGPLVLPAEPVAPAEPDPSEPAPESGDGQRVSPSLRGDPSFDPASLTGDAALWYQRLWLDIDQGSFDPIALAGQDDIYSYGRTLHTYVQSVLVAFRLTGDLALLDHVDEIAERMRSELHDSWRDTLDGTDDRDGYLNWVDRYEGGTHRGKDTMKINEIKTHALVAMMAYALEANRDLQSPGGRDYAAHADFWSDYLVNHFEAKWRERTGEPTQFPIMTKVGTHTYYAWIKWHYYMGLLTGDDAYTQEANRMADNVWTDLRPIETPTGTAYVWAGRIASAGAGSGSEILQATNYARYVYGDMIEFHLEGFHNWASTSQMQRFARTFTEFMIDSDDPMRDGFASDVGGGVDRAGLISGDKDRMSRYRYRESSYPLIAAWDTTGRVEELNEAAYASVGSDGAAWLTAGSMLNASWPDGSYLASSQP